MAIQNVAVLGSGVMGGGIAAHLVNAGLNVKLFDLTLEQSQKGLEFQTKIKPAAFFNKKQAGKISTFAFDDVTELEDMDWVIEVIVERLDIKQSLFKKIAPHIGKNAILSSNTSGLSMAAMAEVLPEDLKSRFFITHFFNPPRYLKLVEVVRPEKYNAPLFDEMVAVLQNGLGKGVVETFDTPNFIANRIGVYSMMKTIEIAMEKGLNITEVDQLTGPLIGHPKSATFRTADVVGLDTMCHVANNSYETLTDDPFRETFKLPAFMTQLVEKGWLGQKSKIGFYKKEGKVITALDFASMEHVAQQKGKWDSVKKAKKENDLPKRFKGLAAGGDAASEFLHESNLAVIAYSAYCLGKVATTVEDIDNALKWGFGWKMGPFEIWDALGVNETLEQMKEKGYSLPEWTENLNADENFSFYRKGTNFQPHIGEEKPIKTIPGFINLSHHEVVAKNGSASLVDIGDGVLNLRLHSAPKPDINPIDDDIVKMQYKALEIIPGKYKGLVIGNQQDNFSAGANILMILMASRQGAWDQIRALVDNFQKVNIELKYAPFPVISCPFNLTLGGGYELAAGSDKIFAHAETYMGLVEVGVGLLPAGAGCFQLLNNLSAKAKYTGNFAPMQRSFEAIGFAKVTMSGKEGFSCGYLQKGRDQIVMNGDQLIGAAKSEVLSMAENYETPERPLLSLPGESGRLVLDAFIDDKVKDGTITEHDALIGKKISFVLSGGNYAKPSAPVTIEQILELEQEAFLQLCGEEKTQARIEHMLMKNKPLRN